MDLKSVCGSMKTAYKVNNLSSSQLATSQYKMDILIMTEPAF